MKSKKILIMKTRPGISDQEIQSMMDFKKVLDVHRSAQKKIKLLWSSGIVGGAIVVFLITWQLVKSPEQQQVQQPEVSQPEVLQDSTSIASEPNAQPVQEPVLQKPKTTTTAPAVKEEPKQEQPIATPPVYTEAEPVAGFPELYAWFQKELKYPVEAEKDSIEGIVSVSFVINKEGKPEQVRLLNSLGKLFDDEVMRVITTMPEWKPATLNGKPVPARISMPLTFQITRIQKQ